MKKGDASRTSFLLIAFRFPPYSRIGAYRWAKLCGRLAQLGHSIDVATVNWMPPSFALPVLGKPQPQPWFSAIEHPNIRVHRTRSGYPHLLESGTLPNRWANKAKHRLTLTVRGVLNPLDAAANWGPHLIPVVEQLVGKQGHQVVVATGAPFSANYWAAKLKQKYPRLRLIQDFRDPWFSSEAEMRGRRDADRFRLATSAADKIVAVTPEMAELYKELGKVGKVDCVPNGVELNELTREGEASREREQPYDCEFAYIGSLYNGRDVPLRRFLDWARSRRGQRNVRTVLAGRYDHSIGQDFADLVEGGQLVLKEYLEQREAFKLLRDSRVALQFNGPGPLGLSQTTTKLVEHAALGRPTLSLNYGGAVPEFVRARALGWSLLADAPDLAAQLDRVAAEALEPHAQRSPQDLARAVADHDFDETSKRYSELIDELG